MSIDVIELVDQHIKSEHKRFKLSKSDDMRRRYITASRKRPGTYLYIDIATTSCGIIIYLYPHRNKVIPYPIETDINNPNFFLEIDEVLNRI